MWHFSKVGMLKSFLDWRDSGEKTEAELLELCLARIREQEPRIQAWVEVCPQPAQTQGPLRGIPFGAKDIFETAGMATEYGSPIYAGRKGRQDAGLVRELKERGAVLLGKTQTTAFAYFDPAPTRNPRNLEHTPGGSSSGSAAAVAAGMVPFALGSQTQGSVLRPASFCGVVGFKPTHGLLPLEGVLSFAPSLDTAGLFTPTAEDMRLLWERMGFPVDRTDTPPRLGVPAALPELDPAMEWEFRLTATRLRAAGLRVETIELPPDFAKLRAASKLINDYEGARTHRERWREHGLRIGWKLAQMVAEGLRIPSEEYAAALGTVAQVKQEMAKMFEQVPVILTPAAPGPAPAGLASTGDPRMNSPWTALGVPAISIPMPAGDGLPLGLQMTAGAGRDGFLVAVAGELEPQMNTDEH
ncbi:MAG TPA: amidase [Bryobacterales bacterium]|nr:amidase [Bryobacterales bacterium]